MAAYFIDSSALVKCHKLKSDLQSEYQVVEIQQSIINSAMELAEAHGLRGYDAVQLAAGCAINVLCRANSLPSVTFVSADNELNIAAASEGMYDC
ncbi:type II toxin-antitoxin system VapC family toxin [Coleofasciculus sp. E1-EBD-02]|uniref:type II toxin-antitoxin system VapC family toxin n=1 Tax=Coleofasciculus sp. E1-EBD-02 TaxID=3068481 RepID=UPI0032F0F935